MRTRLSKSGIFKEDRVMKIASDFIKSLGYEAYAYVGVSVYVDKIGYYHLKIHNYEFKVDLTLKKSHSLEHDITFSPVPGHKIKNHTMKFIWLLRQADTAQLWEDLDKMRSELWEARKKAAYDDYKRDFGGDWNDYKEGSIHYGFGVNDYGCDVEDGDLYVPEAEVIDARCEGVLAAWEEGTGREDIYLSFAGGGEAYICSK